MSGNNPLVMGQPLADIMIVETILKSLEDKTKNKKYLRAQAAYHLQQACEKLIKIQIYASGKQVRNDKIYKHSLQSLSEYAEEIGIELIIPDYISDNLEIITSWEAEGRYDMHMVVRKDRLQKTCIETKAWYQQLKKSGYQ